MTTIKILLISGIIINISYNIIQIVRQKNTANCFNAFCGWSVALMYVW